VEAQRFSKAALFEDVVMERLQKLERQGMKLNITAAGPIFLGVGNAGSFPRYVRIVPNCPAMNASPPTLFV
jgi:hypothetical protein